MCMRVVGDELQQISTKKHNSYATHVYTAKIMCDCKNYA